MNTTARKNLALGALALGSLFANGSAFAAAVNCSTVTFLSQLTGQQGIDGCIQEDKLFNNFVFDVPTSINSVAVKVAFSSFTVGDTDYHSFQLNFDTVPGDGVFTSALGTRVLEYDIAITSPDRYFTEVNLDSTVVISSGSTTTTMDLTPNVGPFHQLNGLNGANVAYQMPDSPTSIHVLDTISASGDAFFTNYKNTFVEATVTIPEIDAVAGSAALALLSGVLALAGERRRGSARKRDGAAGVEPTPAIGA